MRIRISGLANVEKQLKDTLKEYEKTTDEVVQEIAQGIYDRSQRLVPVDTGKLKESGELEKLADKEYEVSYFALNDKGDFDYSIIQHENLSFAHAPGQSAKYLELAVDFGEIDKILTKYYGK